MDKLKMKEVPQGILRKGDYVLHNGNRQLVQFIQIGDFCLLVDYWSWSEMTEAVSVLLGNGQYVCGTQITPAL